ncbi:Lecithin:cholesterol acyltransferase-domain-containing protein [Mycena olivaceomarginata]|nr:Lecithin:cholesterol acyltransferase-domain-containing protein [Mycena olivaceomarginata]
MLSLVTFNRDKWISAMMLDPVTGLDPLGAKVRAAEGINAASSFIQGYWIWSKIVENLAAVNYDTNNLYLGPYDWRLSYYNLEERDGYFSRSRRPSRVQAPPEEKNCHCRALDGCYRACA